MVFVPTLHIKISVSYDCIMNMCYINHRRNAYKASMLLLLLSSLVTQKVLQYSIGIATEQSFRYIELTDAKIWISKNASLCQVLANGSHMY